MKHSGVVREFGPKGHSHPTRHVVSWAAPDVSRSVPESQERQTTESHLTGVGAIEGVVEPLTMGLRAGETYPVALLMDRYYVLDGSEKLATWIKRPCQLWVELEVTDARCPNPMALDPLRRTLSCWRGKVVSNVLQLRK